ncbi:hypothetical protein [Mesorhizobium sp. RIZ17]|uniref:hypothetical protein n=1 Tax=Mesorhizobium sp. RIZ17 TaxID=3132743 RepID=UPI003DA81708
MIIEFFGPPGSGKSTLAHSLAGRLRDRGWAARVILCYQPRNKGDSWDRFGVISVITRISSAIFALCAAFLPSAYENNGVRLSNKLIRIIPPKQIIWRVRMWQYIVRLSLCWKQSQESTDVTIFDQGFVQAIGSLAMFNDTTDDRMIAQALFFAPPADLVIRLVVPRDIVEARLQARMRLEPAAERLFEVDVAGNMNAFDVFDKIGNVVQRGDQSILSVHAVDQESTAIDLRLVEEEILAQLSRTGLHPANQWQGGTQSTGKAVL